MVATVRVAHLDRVDLPAALRAAMVPVARQVAVTAATVLPDHQVRPVRPVHVDGEDLMGRLVHRALTDPVAHQVGRTAATVPAGLPARMGAVVHRVAL